MHAPSPWQDTGNWEDSCNLTGGKGQPQACHYPYPVNCSVWDLQQGTFDHFSHVLLDNVQVTPSGIFLLLEKCRTVSTTTTPAPHDGLQPGFNHPDTL
jgi:hypothetical protein